jgi:hypothetical protein
MARLLLEDVTLQKEQRVIAQIRFKGGAERILEIPLPLPFYVRSRTRPEVVEAIDDLLDEHEYKEIVDLLNARGLRSGDGRRFNVHIVGHICKQSGLKSRRERLRENGLITLKEMARLVRVKDGRITQWRQEGRIAGYRSNFRTEYLYLAPTPAQIVALTGRIRNEEKTSSRGR